MSQARASMGAILFKYFLLFSVFGSLDAQMYDQETCDKDDVIRCAKPLKLIHPDNKERSTFATSKEDLDRMCPDMKRGLTCIEKYTKRCMNEDQQKYFNHLYKGTTMVIQDLCHEGPYQKEFLKHAPCVLQIQEKYEECAVKYVHELNELNLKAINISSSQAEREENVQKVCCSFQKYMTCSEEIVLETCGSETAKFTKGFLDKMARPLLQVHCERYPVNSAECSGNKGVRLVTAGNQQVALMLGLLLMLLLLQFIRT